MMNGRNNGKKLLAVRIVKHAFDIIYLLTDQNPLQVTVDAIVNCGPREDSTRIGSAGTVRRQAVDVSPLRRVNQAIALLTIGAREAAFRNVKTVAECLAEELINAAKYTTVCISCANWFLGDPRRRMLSRRRMNLNVLLVRIVEGLVTKVSIYLAISLHVDVE
jgi:ribosomal protein uS7